MRWCKPTRGKATEINLTTRLALLATVLALDAVIALLEPGYAVLGLLDEPAHLATTALLLAGAAAGRRRWSSRTWFAALAAGVLIDLDHLPRALGSDLLTAGTPRPYSHSLCTVGVLLVAAALARRTPAGPVLGAGAFGVGAHLLRDLATAPVSLWWPVTDRAVEIPYSVYAVVLLVAAALGSPPAREPMVGDAAAAHP